MAGHSWGANLALAYALDHADRCLGLIYLCGTGLREDWKESYRRAHDERGERIPEFAFPFNRQVNAVGNRSFSEYLRSPGLRERAAALRVPALLVAAGRDLRPTAPARELAGLLPHVRFELIPDAEHYLWLTDADPLRVILRDFLATFPPVAR